MTILKHDALDEQAISKRLNELKLSPDWFLFGKGEQPRAIGAFLNTHEHALLTLFRSSKDDVKRAILAGLMGASPALVDLPANEFEVALKRHLEAVWPGEAVSSLANN